MHTKGPWKLKKTSAGCTITNSEDIWIADLGNEWYPSTSEISRFEANARLIAAAPELLAFVEDIATLFKWHEGTIEYLIEAAQELVRKAKEG